MVGSANYYSVVETVVIMGGISFIIITIAVGVILFTREEKGRPVFPWSARTRVEKAKAHTEILQEHLEQEALEVKRLAVSYQRTQVLKAIDDEDTENVMRLGLPSGQGKYQQENSRNY